MTHLLSSASQLALNGLWQGVLVAAVVAGCLRVLPRVSAAQRFAVWVTAFAIAAGLPFVELAGVHAARAEVEVGQGWGAAVACVWLALAVVRGSRLLLQAARVRRIWLAARAVSVPAAIESLLRACPRGPQVCASDAVDAPSVIGFWSPRLLIPSTMLAELTEDEFRQIVLHECEHLRRGDDWLNLLQKVAIAVFPLNLGLLWVDSRLGLERELACDAGVVAATGGPLEYASCLTRLAERRLGGGRLVLALSAWARRSELARRVYTLLDPVRGLSRAGSRGALAAIACVLLATADGIAHAPRIVSFASPAAAAVADVQYAQPLAPAVPVIFRADRQPSIQLTSTSAPRARKASALRHRSRPAAEPGFYTTAAPRRVEARSYMVPVEFTYSYAAVPFGDGWLIVQL
jgi:beta-lactamase regulating signal transducer with metallopeptidase domain